MALNFQQLGMLAKLKSAFSTFQQQHPKFMPFIHAVKGDACRKDSIIEISVKSPEGRNYTTNFRVTEKDLELIQMLKDMQENQYSIQKQVRKDRISYLLFFYLTLAFLC